MEKRSSRNQNGPILRLVEKLIRFLETIANGVIKPLLLFVDCSCYLDGIALLAEGLKGIPLVNSSATTVSQSADSKEKTTVTEQETSARIMANGDLLYHDIIYISAKKADGTYDFHETLK